jgi:hypothetical protein
MAPAMAECRVELTLILCSYFKEIDMGWKYKPLLLGAIALVMLGGMAGTANATLQIWENSAGSDMGSFDPITGVETTTLTQNKGNGRGIVVVGDTVYYTVADSGNVFKRSASTNVDGGIAFSIAGASGLQAITFDGTNFWVGDYSGSTKAYLVTPTGTLLNTITLDPTITKIEGFYDGLEFFNGKLIANRYDGGFARSEGNQYSIYNLDGTLFQANFINTLGHGNGTGIAFDGTNFFVSDIFNNQISVWDANGVFVKDIVLVGSHRAIEDLSVDFAGRSDTCGGIDQPPCSGVPEPASLVLLGIGLAVFGAMRRRKA